MDGKSERSLIVPDGVPGYSYDAFDVFHETFTVGLFMALYEKRGETD